MELTARRPLLAVATLTTAGALALAPITVAPHAPSVSPMRISTDAVQLTDAWSDLAGDTVVSVVTLGAMFLGADSSYPLPSPTIPFAPVITQLVLNQLIYAAQLFTGNGGQIPGEIATHVDAALTLAGEAIGAVPALLGEWLKLPFSAAQVAIEYVTTATNPLLALFQAPAVFLNLALNNQYGLFGQVGPIGFPIIIRNILAKALYTPPPTITLPFKKAASTPKSAAAAIAAPSPAAPSGTASSARTKSAAPTTGSRKASAKAAKAPTAKATNKSGAGTGQGHSKRG